MVVFSAFMAALMWFGAWAAIIVIFGVNGLLVAGVIHFIALLAVFVSILINA